MNRVAAYNFCLSLYCIIVFVTIANEPKLKSPNVHLQTLDQSSEITILKHNINKMTNAKQFS